jgi:hypothetical protein
VNGGDREEYNPPRRKRNFTDEDVDALAAAMKGHSVCNLGLTSDEVSTLKRFLQAFDKAAGIVGKVILTVCVAALIAVFTKGFWVSLATGIKQVNK